MLVDARGSFDTAKTKAGTLLHSLRGLNDLDGRLRGVDPVMPPRPFGIIGDQHRRAVEQQAKYRAEVRRQEAKFEFELFLRKQRERIAATLQRQTERIHRARFGDCEGDGSHFVVMRTGSTEVSGPVKRMYQEQRNECEVRRVHDPNRDRGNPAPASPRPAVHL